MTLLSEIIDDNSVIKTVKLKAIIFSMLLALSLLYNLGMKWDGGTEVA